MTGNLERPKKRLAVWMKLVGCHIHHHQHLELKLWKRELNVKIIEKNYSYT